jgi:hypothetical protein
MLLSNELSALRFLPNTVWRMDDEREFFCIF